MSVVFVPVLLLAGLLSASSPAQKPPPAPTKNAKPASLAPGLEPLLQLADASVKAEPSLRIAVLNEVAFELCSKGEKKRCQQLLEEVLSSAPPTDDVLADWVNHQRRTAIESLAELDLDRAIELAQTDTRPSDVYGTLAEHLADRNQQDRALELLKSAGASNLNFHTALHVANKLPKDHDDLRFQELFALTREAFYSGNERARVPFYGIDRILIEFQDRIPSGLLVGTMLDVLKSVKEQEGDHPESVTLGARSGSVFFNSNYDVLATEFLPIIRRYDPARADAIERDNAQLTALNQRFPQGLDSMMPRIENPLPGDPRERDVNYVAYGEEPKFQQEENRDAEVMRAFEHRYEDPEQTLANASSLRLDMRFQLLANIIRRYAEKQPSLAHEAADQFVSAAQTEEIQFRVQRVIQLIYLLGELHDHERAATVLAHSLPELSKVYEWDNAPADPNLRPKIEWISTVVARQMLFAAARFAPNLLPRVITETPDDDVKLLLKIYAAEFQFKLRQPTDRARVPSRFTVMRNHDRHDRLGVVSSIE